MALLLPALIITLFSLPLFDAVFRRCYFLSLITFSITLLLVFHAMLPLFIDYLLPLLLMRAAIFIDCFTFFSYAAFRFFFAPLLICFDMLPAMPLLAAYLPCFRYFAARY